MNNQINKLFWCCLVVFCSSANGMDHDVDDELARAIELSLQQTQIQPSVEEDFDFAMKLYLDEDLDIHQDPQVPQAPVAQPVPAVQPVPQEKKEQKRSQQELDADYALALELQMRDQEQVALEQTAGAAQGRQRFPPLDPREQRRRAYATEMAVKRHIMNPHDANQQLVMNILPDGSIELPSLIRELPIPIKHLRVIQQTEKGSCGSRSVANALALRDVLNWGLPLNSDSICEIALSYEKLHARTEVQNGSTALQQLEDAANYGLKDAYTLRFFQMDLIKKTEFNRFPFTVIGSCREGGTDLNFESEILEEIVRAFRSKKTAAINFLCHLDGDKDDGPGHAVVISIIKQAGQPAQIIYMDSNNTPVANQSQAAACICYLYWQFVAE